MVSVLSYGVDYVGTPRCSGRGSTYGSRHDQAYDLESFGNLHDLKLDVRPTKYEDDSKNWLCGFRDFAKQSLKDFERGAVAR